MGSKGSEEKDFRRGIILAYFQMSGKVLVVMERLIMWVNAGVKISAASLTVLVSIKSTPVAEEFFKLWMTLITSDSHQTY